MASSSSSSRSPLSRPPSKPMASDVFKPKLPRDPFTKMPRPWTVKVDSVVSAMNASRRDVLLVLGAPSLKDIEPLLQSQYLEASLIILATHQPPEITATSSFPTVRILRLDAPLAIEDSGAVRFVNVLEAAERIARVWRKSGGSGVEEIRESDPDGLNDPASLAPPSFRFAPAGGSTPGSPHSSTDQLSIHSSTSTMKRRLRSVSSMSLPKGNKTPKLPPVDSSQRPFDSLLNFLPSRSSDKALLKQMILVTTISRPFLTSASNPTRNGGRASTSRSSSRLSVAGGANEEGRRWSTLLNRQSIYSAPTTPSSNRSRTSLFSGSGSSVMNAPPLPPLPTIPRRAHIVHLITPTAPSIGRSKLMQSMESFLCSFAYPAPGEISQPDAAGMERAAPFLMHPYTLKAVARVDPATTEGQEGQWTIAELLLSGSLDRAAGANDADKAASAGMAGIGAALGAPPPRAWLSNANDIVFVPASRPASTHSANMPTPPQLTQLPPSPNRGRSSYLGTSELGIVGAGGTMGSSTWSGPAPEGGPRMPAVSLNSFSGKGKEREGSFQVPHFRSSTTPGSLPTPPDSEESDSSGSVMGGETPGRASSPPSPAPPTVSEPERKSKGLFKSGSRKGLGMRWKFWKAAPATVSI